MILMIDNYDSFTYNLVHYLEELGQSVLVKRNDQISLNEVAKLQPSAILISPGPGNPDSAGVSLSLIKHLSPHIPTLGVCLGHQALAQVFGGHVVKAKRLMHGKTSAVYHDHLTIFKDIPSPYQATRYHSLAVERSTLPACLEVSAWEEEGEIMGIRHRDYPLEGVQFHPESILTEWGHRLLVNFLAHYTGQEELRRVDYGSHQTSC